MLTTSEAIVYCEGEFYQSRDALIRPLNRGFLYGETLFTTMRTLRGKYLFLDQHLERLKKGITFLFPGNLDFTVMDEIMRGLSLCLTKRGLWNEQDIRVRVPVFLDNNDFVFAPKKNQLKFLIIIGGIGPIHLTPIKLSIAKKIKTAGLVPPYVKLGNYTEELIELRAAKEKGFDDILFLRENNKLAECSTSNIFYRKGGILYTPKVVNGILDGITRRKLIECLQGHGFKISIDEWNLDHLLSADEAWATSSVSGILEIIQLEEKKFSLVGSKNSWTKKIRKMFLRFCEEDVLDD